jgi:hypothetical protein
MPEGRLGPLSTRAADSAQIVSIIATPMAATANPPGGVRLEPWIGSFMLTPRRHARRGASRPGGNQVRGVSPNGSGRDVELRLAIHCVAQLSTTRRPRPSRRDSLAQHAKGVHSSTLVFSPQADRRATPPSLKAYARPATRPRGSAMFCGDPVRVRFPCTAAGDPAPTRFRCSRSPGHTMLGERLSFPTGRRLIIAAVPRKSEALSGPARRVGGGPVGPQRRRADGVAGAAAHHEPGLRSANW